MIKAPSDFIDVATLGDLVLIVDENTLVHRFSRSLPMYETQLRMILILL